MPVQIDEVSTEIEPSRTGDSPAPPPAAAETSPEAELRKMRDMRARLEARAARVFAD